VVECAGLEIRYTVIPYRGFESLPFRQVIIQIKALGPFFVSIYQSSYQFRAGLESTDPDSVERSQAAHCSKQPALKPISLHTARPLAPS
jgi:hypothetical protein